MKKEKLNGLVTVGRTKKWYKNNKLHREGGPAIEWDTGVNWFFVNGKRMTERAFNTWRVEQEAIKLEQQIPTVENKKRVRM